MKVLKVSAALLLLTVSFTMVACSTAVVRVMPGQKGLVKVFARDIELDGAEVAAHKAAKEYCEEYDREAIFLKQKSGYQGTMDEGTRKTVRGASKAVSNLPVIGFLGTVGNSMTGDRDYLSAALFKCGAKIN
jgi:hypothetical protein